MIKVSSFIEPTRVVIGKNQNIGVTTRDNLNTEELQKDGYKEITFPDFKVMAAGCTVGGGLSIGFTAKDGKIGIEGGIGEYRISFDQGMIKMFAKSYQAINLLQGMGFSMDELSFMFPAYSTQIIIIGKKDGLNDVVVVFDYGG